jgi:hypothetical protein
VAEEVQGSVTGGNGERLSFQVGTKSFGVAARDLVPILLLVLMGVGGYLLYLNVSKGVHGIEQRQMQTHDMLHRNQLSMVEALTKWHVMLNEQEQAITVQLRHQNELLATQTETFRRLLQAHDFNMGRPLGERIPLEVAPESAPPRHKD